MEAKKVNASDILKDRELGLLLLPHLEGNTHHSSAVSELLSPVTGS